MNLKSVMMVGTSVCAFAVGANLLAWGGSAWTDLGGTTHYNFGGRTGSSWTDLGGTTHYNFGGRTGSSWTDLGGTTHFSGSLFRGQALNKKLFADADFAKKADSKALQQAITTRNVDALTSCAWDLKGLETILEKKDSKTTSAMLFNLAAKLAVEQGNEAALKAIIKLAPECKNYEAQIAMKGKTRGINQSVVALPQLTVIPEDHFEKAMKELRPWEQPLLGKYMYASFRGMPISDAVTATTLVNDGRITMNPQMIALGAMEFAKYPYDRKLGIKFEPARIFAEAAELAIVKQDKEALEQIIAVYGTAKFKTDDYAKYLQNALAMMSSVRGMKDGSGSKELNLTDFTKTIMTVYYETPDLQVK